MLRLKIDQVFAGLMIAVMALIVVHAPLQVFFSQFAAENALYIKGWKELLMFAAIPLALVMISKRRSWPELVADKLFWLIVAYAMLHILALLQWQGLEASLAGLIIDLRYILFFALCYVLIGLYPRYRQLMLRIALIGAAVVVSFGMLQLLLPADALKVLGYSESTIAPYNTIDRNDDFIRYQSTLRGPNPYGAYAASVVIIGLAWLTARRWDWRLGLLTAAATLSTYLSHSRSAFIALGVGVIIVLGYRYGGKIRRWQWGALVGLALVAGLGLFALRDSYFVSNILLHEDPVGGSSVSSNDEHLRSLVEGTENALQDPLGDGVGSSGSASILAGDANIIENQYLMIAHEVGWLGLALFAAIYGTVMYRLWLGRKDPWALGVFASGIGLALIGMLLPVWADDTVSIVWWGLAAVVLAPSLRVTKAKR